MVRDFFFVNLSDVTVKRMPALEVLGIGFLCVGVPFAGENTLPPNGFKSQSYASNAGKQINETKVPAFARQRAKIQKPLQLCCDMRWWDQLPGLPPTQVAGRNSKMTCYGGLAMGFAGGSKISDGCGVIGSSKYGGFHCFVRRE